MPEMPDLPDEPTTVAEVTEYLGVHYVLWKDHEASKDEYKVRFFELATAACADRAREEILVSVEAYDEAQAREHLEKYNPRHAIDVIRMTSPHDRGATYEAIMIERPEYVSFTYVNLADETVYQRTVQDGAQLLDDERLRQENDLLYNQVVFQTPWGTTILRPLDMLHAEDLAALAEYFYRGKPIVKLTKPRPAKPEELEALYDA